MLLGSVSLVFQTVLLVMPETYTRFARIPDYTPLWRSTTQTIAAGSVLAAVLLIVVGVGFVRRRRWAVRAVWIWAVAKVFVALMAAMVAYVAFENTMRDETVGPNASIAAPVAIMRIASLLFVFVGLLWAWALPIFVFVWFGRERVRAEVDLWRQ